MRVEGYPHVIEYSRERAEGVRDRRYTEHVDDMGFCLEHKAGRRERWLARYARACAEDYFGRVRAPHGTWVVSVYRLGATRQHLVTVRMNWGKESAPRPSELSPLVRR